MLAVHLPSLKSEVAASSLLVDLRLLEFHHIVDSKDWMTLSYYRYCDFEGVVRGLGAWRLADIESCVDRVVG